MNRTFRSAAFVYLVTALCLATSAALFAQTPVVLATADTAPFSTPDGRGFYDLLLVEAFSRLEIPLEIRRLPSERSLQEANNGRVDGEFGRIRAISAEYPNLHIVDESLSVWEFLAFGMTGTKPPESFQDLERFRVGYIQGWKIYEDMVGDTRSLTVVVSEEQLFSVLLANRVDVVLYNKLRGQAWLQRNPGTEVEMAPAPLATREMYLFLHESQRSLIPALEATLQAMKNDGTYEQLELQAFGFVP